MTQTITIQIQVRNVYGNALAYPMNGAAESLARIANSKTLTRNTLANALAMGITIIEIDRHNKPCALYEMGGNRNLPTVQ